MKTRFALPLAAALAICVAAPPAGRAAPAPAGQTAGQSIDDAVQWLRDRVQDAGPALADGVRQVLDEFLAQMQEVGRRLGDMPRQTQQDLEESQRVLAARWGELVAALETTAANSDYNTVAIQIVRLIENLMVTTRGHVTQADGTPARGVVVVRFLTGTRGLNSPDAVPTGYAVTDANGDYAILSPDGLLMAARYAAGTAQADGTAVPPSVVIPLELLPTTPPYREVSYDARGNATVTAGDRPMSAWELLGL